MKIWVHLKSLFTLMALAMSITGQWQFMPKQVGENTFKDIIMSQTDCAVAEIGRLNELAGDYRQDKTTLDTLKRQLTLTRLAYKRLESIATYYYPEHIKFYINGAPLPYIDPLSIGEAYQKKDYYVVSPEEYRQSAPLDKLEPGHFLDRPGRVKPPEGLQVLDELIFSDEAPNHREKIEILCQKLKSSFDVIREALAYRKYYYDEELIEAVRLELVRILSRGITGFDTPGSLNALQETSAALYGIGQIVRPFLDRTGGERQKSITGLFSRAQAYLAKHQDFETFDRLTFIYDFLNPLYDQLLRLQMDLGIKSTAEIHNRTPSWNAYSRNVFAPDFLNPYYYSMLKERDDSPSLRKLGKKLFFDTRLSSNNSMSCAGCHKPGLAYTDGKAVPTAGIPGKTLLRNAPTLVNAVYSDRYFYDLRAFDLEDQLGHVIEDHLEFNTDYEEIVTKLNRDTSYTKSFDSVFGNKGITRHRIASALASFVISLKSGNSLFDKYMRGETRTIDNKIKQGFNLFMGKANCATCHYAPTFSGLVPPLFVENESEILGVLEAPGSHKIDSDPGRSKNGVPNEDQGIYNHAFKTTTVRNVELTAPYFHNGAYKTLDEVIDFYNKGGAAGMGWSPEWLNQTLDPEPLDLSTSEIEAIKAFLNALTDVPEDD